MQADTTPEVERAIQSALADESATELCICWFHLNAPPLTGTDVRRIIDCLRENPRFYKLTLSGYDIRDAAAAVVHAFRNGLPLCTSIAAVRLINVQLGCEDLEILLPAFYNKSVTSLSLYMNHIDGQRGGEVIRDLFVGNRTLRELDLGFNAIGPEGAIELGNCFVVNDRLQELHLSHCHIANDGLANLVTAFGDMKNSFLTNIDLSHDNIEGAEGGQQVSLLLQRLPALRGLQLDFNNLGPLGARALAPGLTLPNLGLENLHLFCCGLGNDGVANLIPNGQVNRSLTTLDLRGNDIRGLVGGENVLALASRCTNLDSINVDENTLSPDQQRCLDLVLDRKRLCTEAQALGGSPPSVVFEKLVQANFHEQGLSASFVILRDYIFAEQQRNSSSPIISEPKVQEATMTGVKRKRNNKKF